MRLGFTGHRDRMAPVEWMEQILPVGQKCGDVWIHGGAVGFDTQVGEFAKVHGIEVTVIRPDYDLYGPRKAPLERNKLIVQDCYVLIALWDGRTKGGTYQTMNYAKSVGRTCLIWKLEE